jgi:hypothetical protein
LKSEAKSVYQRLESTTFIEIPKEFHLFKWPLVASKKRKVKKWWCRISGVLVFLFYEEWRFFLWW